MDFSDLDTSLKVTLPNVTLYSNWLYNNRAEISRAENRSNYITSRIGFVESNRGAIISFLKKTGLVTSSLEVSPLAILIAKEELTYRELCLIHLSKESLFLNGKPKVNLITLLSAYIREKDQQGYNLNELRNLNMSFHEIEGNKNSNSRTDYIMTILEGTDLFVHQDRIDDGVISLTPKTKPIINYFADRPIENCEEPLNSAKRFDFFSSLEGGVFSILSNNLPTEWLELYPHLTLNNIQKIKNALSSTNMNTSNESHQIIYYGAPGTGKSHEVKKLTGEMLDNGEKQDLPNVFRTTFHPDTDYASFVGCYKPAMESKEPIYTQAQLIDKLSIIKNSGASYPCQKFGAKYWESLKELSANDIKQILTACGFTDSMSVEVPKGVAIGEEFASINSNKQIVYRFVPQVFTDAYIYAYTTKEPTYLVIEEINRGNCAQIFGDLFQLLDRKDGKSEYRIKADKDLAQYLRDQLGAESEGIKDGKLCLPANLHILATMNTSDQSLFPMDSAFKRRWEWKYMKIVRPYKKNEDGSFKTDENGEKIHFKYTIEGGHDWWEFLQQINAIIDNMTNSADKQLGYFFAKAKDDIISYDTFVSKVCFYLWNDIFKTYALDERQGDLFSYKDEEGQKKQFTFPAFYDGDGNVITAVVEAFINNVMDWNNKNDKA